MRAVSVAIVDRDSASSDATELFVGLVAGGNQCLRASEEALGPRCPGRGGSFRQPLECAFGGVGLAASGGRLDEVGERERAEDDAVVVVDMSRRPKCGVVPTGAELEHGERGVGVVDADALSALVGVLHHAPGAGPGGVLVSLPRVAQHLAREPVTRAVRATP